MSGLTGAPARVARTLLARHERAPAAVWPAYAVAADDVERLPGPAAFRRTLMELIARAERRIVIVALYLQDDDAGRAVLDALDAASAARPGLEVSVLVDWHRAHRGLIGGGRSAGNAAMYRRRAHAPGARVRIYGVPVQTRELFGVLHLKGFVFDDTVLYSGASLNDVYLMQHGTYRLDRYQRIRHAGLADALASFALGLAEHPATGRLDAGAPPPGRPNARAIRDLRDGLAHARYAVPGETTGPGQVAVTPLLGFGRRGNALDAALIRLLDDARTRAILFTPYFNLPAPVRLALNRMLRRGCTVDIMVGDKTANDFFIPPDQPFKTIGLLPYLYENNLRRFMRRNAAAIARGQLAIHLWRDGGNSFHLKGLFVDQDITVLTGSNLNPRAWSLDLENALVLRDPSHLLCADHEAEWAALRVHATRLGDHRMLEDPHAYPAVVQKNLKRLTRIQLDRLVNRLL